MTQRHVPLPGLNRQGNAPSLPDITVWESGYRYGISLVADALDDARHAIIPMPRLSHEERVQARIREMEQCADWTGNTWRGQCPGGPVDWETGAVIR